MILEKHSFYLAKQKENIQHLKTLLTDKVNNGILSNDDIIVSNSRHFEALSNALSPHNSSSKRFASIYF